MNDTQLLALMATMIICSGVEKDRKYAMVYARQILHDSVEFQEESKQSEERRSVRNGIPGYSHQPEGVQS